MIKQSCLCGYTTVLVQPRLEGEISETPRGFTVVSSSMLIEPSVVSTTIDDHARKIERVGRRVYHVHPFYSYFLEFPFPTPIVIKWGELVFLLYNIYFLVYFQKTLDLYR